jgi:mRNA-degrading endonuclease RelE of RelBE toxin-antitoxin system
MELIFHPDVKGDIASLDGSIKNLLKKILKKIKNAPESGKPLRNKGNTDLSGCLKIYFYKKKYRVVYEILEDDKVIVWSIGENEKMKLFI